MIVHASEKAKHMADGVSLSVAVGTVADWLPEAAALLTIVWTAIRIFETRTVQRLIGRAGETGPAA